MNNFNLYLSQYNIAKINYCLLPCFQAAVLLGGVLVVCVHLLYVFLR